MGWALWAGGAEWTVACWVLAGRLALAREVLPGRSDVRKAGRRCPQRGHTHLPTVQWWKSFLLILILKSGRPAESDFPLVQRAVSSGLRSCIENLKIKLHQAFMFDFLSSLYDLVHASRTRVPPASVQTIQDSRFWESVGFSVWNVLSPVILAPYLWHLWQFVISFIPLNFLCLWLSRSYFSLSTCVAYFLQSVGALWIWIWICWIESLFLEFKPVFLLKEKDSTGQNAFK